ncbi:TPA: hypothetical protein HA265_01490 [Candidatus Woesearchaeota archaeon]|nr:hypothetical protein [Candidatus Woesearchaeota archaeon]
MRRTAITTIFVLMILIFSLPVALASDKYFYVKSTGSPYKALAGDKITVDFVLVNKDLKAPKNVTAYIEGCPLGWICEEKLFSYDKEDAHPENLTIKVAKTAMPKRYTFYVKLDSWYPVTRGDDKVLVNIVTESDLQTLTYEEYKAREEQTQEEEEELYIPPEDSGATLVSVEEASKEEIKDALELGEISENAAKGEAEAGTEEEMTPETVPEEKKSIEEVKEEVVENLERLESDRGFVEYATVVLLILLIVVGTGAILAFVKKDKK